MNRNSIRYIVIPLALAAIFCGSVVATVESAVPAKAEAPQENEGETSLNDDESSDSGAAEDQTGFNTLEDMLLFRGPLATLWAAPQPATATVRWLELTPKVDATSKQADSGETEE